MLLWQLWVILYMLDIYASLQWYDGSYINLYSYTVDPMHQVENEFSASNFRIVTCSQCLLICCSVFVNVLFFLLTYTFIPSPQDVSELRNELQRKEMLVQKHLSKLHHWQQVLEEVSLQHRKPSDLPPPGPLTFLEQASANLPPAPLKPN